MKHGVKPTRRQKMFIQSKGLNPDNWLVVKDTPEKMVLVHRHSDRDKRVLRKDSREEEAVSPCPICGGEAEVVRDDLFDEFGEAVIYYGLCRKCGLSTGGCGTEEQAVRTWNRLKAGRR